MAARPRYSTRLKAECGLHKAEGQVQTELAPTCSSRKLSASRPVTLA